MDRRGLGKQTEFGAHSQHNRTCRWGVDKMASISVYMQTMAGKMQELRDTATLALIGRMRQLY